MTSPNPDPKLIEKAKELAKRFTDIGQRNPSLEKAIALALQQHGDEQRNLGLEEGAKVAEHCECFDREECPCDDKANAIRSLKRNP